MSIYTITLKRELLNGRANCGQANWLDRDSNEGANEIEAAALRERLVSEGQVYGYNRSAKEQADRVKAGDDSPVSEAARGLDEFSLNYAAIDCLCRVGRRLESGATETKDKKPADSKY